MSSVCAFGNPVWTRAMPSFEALQQHIVERPWRAGLYAFGVLALATLVLLTADTVLRPESFAVRSLSFEGEFRHVDQQALTTAVMDSVRGNFFLLDLDAIRERARAVPWVHEVTVRRRWPDGVHIRFGEQQLVARWGAPEPKGESFARVYPPSVAAQVATAKRVDLRYPNGFSVELANRTGAP